MSTLKTRVQDFERSVLLAELEKGGPVEDVATRLGITRKCLWQKLKRHGLPTFGTPHTNDVEASRGP